MTSQAAQTMPDNRAPDAAVARAFWEVSDGLFGREGDDRYFPILLEIANRAKDYAAAPAASGVHPDALQDGTLSKSTVKRVTALAAASVSERARELLEILAEAIRNAERHPRQQYGLNLETLRALEQALTQQRGEVVGEVGIEGNFIAYAIDDRTGRPQEFAPGTKLYTIPQPSADAVREVIGSMRNFADVADKCELTEGNAQVAIRAWATQLESLLSGVSHA